jgi:hypothetical protein
VKPTLFQRMKHPAGVFVALICWGPAAQAYLVTITAGSRMIFLQVGTGSMGGTGRFTTGGTPQDNATVNSVSVTVPAAALGTGTQAMTSNSAVAVSPYDAFTFCSPPAQVYVGGMYRVPGAGGNASLTVSTPAGLLNAAADAIPFSTISWTSSGIGDASSTIPAGTFSGAANQLLLSVPRNQWFESCLTFSYSNAAAYAAGTFNGRATYTLTAP